MNEEYILELLRKVGRPDAPTAMQEVQRIYLEVHGRSAYDDIGSIGFVESITVGGVTPKAVERIIRSSPEHRARSERAVRAVYVELLRRDPGPPEPVGEWTTGGGTSDPPDNGALGYVQHFQEGLKTLDEVRDSIKTSDEYKNKHQHGRAQMVTVQDFVLMEAERGPSLGVGTSFFYAMSPDVSEDRYLRAVDGLAEAGVEFARFAQTFCWDNGLGMANVVPFRPGDAYTHMEPGSVDFGRAVDWRPDDGHFSELARRLELLVDRGLHAQYTIFWGGMQPLFTLGNDGKPAHPPGEGGRAVIWDRVEPYVRYVAKFFKDHPEHTIEIINEADHGHHLSRIGWTGRKDFLNRCASWIRAEHPEAVITASDGGHEPRIDGGDGPPAGEGSPYFDYASVTGLDYWNVHYPRELLPVEGIPRWCRGSWHLYQDKQPFRRLNPGQGYGRSDENIFLTTEQEFERWRYTNSTRDWRMYALSMWVTTMAGVGFTVHSFKGFFVEPEVAEDPIFKLGVRAFKTITEGFPWHEARQYNTAWADSPILQFDDSFKAFALVGGADRSRILITALNPKGTLMLRLSRPYRVTAYEISGETRDVRDLPAGDVRYSLPPVEWSHGVVLDLRAL